MTCPLSSELKVACEIWHHQSLGERVWFGKLVRSLAWCMDKNTVSESLDTLTDWLIIAGEYGAAENGRAGYLYYVDTHYDGDFRVRSLYEKYWRDERCR
jgi:hypothetical protein